MSAVDETLRWVNQGGPISVTTVRAAMGDLTAQRDEALDRAERAEAAIGRARDALDSVGVLHPVAADRVLRTLDAPQEARSADSGTGGPPEPENGAQGRFGWLRLYPEDDDLLLMQEVPDGWTDNEGDADPLWLRKNYPNAEFTPIRTLADDEVAVKRGDLQWAVDVGRLSGPSETMKRLRAALEAGEGRG